MVKELKQQLEAFLPFNEQEEKDKVLLLKSLKEEDVFLRDNIFHHFTASAWVVNRSRDKVLMAYHNIYDSWAWLGGHADGEQDLLKVAIKEVEEESGLTTVTAVTDNIFSLESLTVDGHMKHNEYISSHLHLNVTYLLEADETQEIRIKPDENSEIAWFPLEKAINASNEPWFRENIYQKLNDKLKKMAES